ncbi:MAG: glycosyltransferase family 4 protein [Alphaproteobacteria bacterium]|nr:glycosyltransferase family 4 protein [Alphaproteobacteria bacterium]
MSEPGRRLLLFTVSRLDEVLAKGNIWYVRHYEAYFERVDVAYLYGDSPRELTQGATRLTSIGARGRFWRSLLLAPWHLYRFARREHPTYYLTADVVFSWWTALLLRWFLGAQVVLMPVSLPEEVYRNSRRSMSGVPIWLERLFLKLSFAAAAKIIASKNGEAQVLWLSAEPRAATKLQVLPATVEEFPTREFFVAAESAKTDRAMVADPVRLLYVGRLHPEKLTRGLIDLVARLRAMGIRAVLRIAGDGPDRPAMEADASTRGVSDAVVWLGYLPNEQLAGEYRDADIFVSTITGTALREAGLCGLPIVAFDADWVKQLLRHEETALLVPVGDIAALASQVARAVNDAALRVKVARNFAALARSRWSLAHVPSSLALAFSDLSRS